MSEEHRAPPSHRIGRLYVRVLVVQALALLALWWLQSSFGGA